VTLHNTNGTWRLNGGIDFTFPTNLTLGAGGYVLVVNFNPATNAAQLTAFKSTYGLTNPSLVILGPYGGKLANNSDRISLEKPQHGDGTNDPVNWVIMDEIIYADQSPWPCGSDGSGNSLQRLNAIQHGSDPANWSAEPPTAGRARASLPAGLPSITSPPQNRVAPTNGNASFSVSVCGTPPFSYQWRFNGEDLADATNSTLNLFNVSTSQAGEYDVVVSNAAGSITSQVATLIVQMPPFIVTHPQPVTTIRDQGASFSVTAGGTPPFSYQWFFNGGNIPGATNSILTLTAVQTNQAGNYSALVLNSAGSALSSSAALTVLVPATITQQPTNRTVLLTTNMTNVSFYVSASGTGTLRYQWRLNGANIPWGTSPVLTVTNVQIGNDGNYSVIVTDNIGSAISANAALTVLVVPVFTAQPANQSAVIGGSVTFGASVLGHPPPFTFELRNPTLGIRTNVESQGTTFFRLNNLTTNDARQYRIVVKNQASSSPGVSTSVWTLSVLPDSDGDGIPDAWETTYGLNSTNAADALLDLDGDGMFNWQEYIAGTDPTNGLSYLKVERISSELPGSALARIEFNAVSNRTYTVLSSDSAPSGHWSRVTDVLPSSTNRLVQVFDPMPTDAPRRFYRLVTPRNP
jgi:hypothetical protein